MFSVGIVGRLMDFSERASATTQTSRQSIPQSSCSQETVGPRRILGAQRRNGRTGIVDVQVVPGGLVGRINGRLQIQRSVLVARAQWDRENGQAFAQRYGPCPLTSILGHR